MIRRRITNRWTGATGSDFRIKRDPAKLLGSAVARSTPPLGDSHNQPDMSPRVVATRYSTIIILGLVGVWLGSVAVDSTDMRRWVGLATLLAAVVGLVVMYLCHVRPTKHETEIAWKQTWSRGRLRFVLRQVLVSQVVWFPILFGAAYELYK